MLGLFTISLILGRHCRQLGTVSGPRPKFPATYLILLVSDKTRDYVSLAVFREQKAPESPVSAAKRRRLDRFHWRNCGPAKSPPVISAASPCIGMWNSAEREYARRE
jgi:hypothetical protein